MSTSLCMNRRNIARPDHSVLYSKYMYLPLQFDLSLRSLGKTFQSPIVLASDEYAQSSLLKSMSITLGAVPPPLFMHRQLYFPPAPSFRSCSSRMNPEGQTVFCTNQNQVMAFAGSKVHDLTGYMNLPPAPQFRSCRMMLAWLVSILESEMMKSIEVMYCLGMVFWRLMTSACERLRQRRRQVRKLMQFIINDTK